MKVVIVSTDVGPCNALRHVEKRLRSQFIKTNGFYGDGSINWGGLEDIEQFVKTADVVLIAFSSTEERVREELFAAETARKNGIPYGFFCNTYEEFNREWFKDLLKDASFVTVINEVEALVVQKLAPKANIVASGNPDWATYFEPENSRGEVREMLSIADDEKMVMVVGSKELERTIPLYANSIMALNDVEEKIRVVLARHPGERYLGHDHLECLDLYKPLCEYSDHPIQFLSDVMKSSNGAVAGCDLIISSISSVGIIAACQRVPVIDLISEIDTRWWDNLGGGRVWPPTALGSTVKIPCVKLVQLDWYISSLLDPEHVLSTGMALSQASYFNKEVFEDSAQMIVDTLLAT